MTTYFVSGTDTDCGKTLVTTGLLRLAAQNGLETVGLKPIAAGCEVNDGVYHNADALMIQQAMTAPLDYQDVNPVALLPPIAPHIAAAEIGMTVTISQLRALLQPGLSYPADLILVEGAGGWLVPLNDSEFLTDLAGVLQMPIILVVGMKLGCLNHALLTQARIEQAGLVVAGWVANQVDPMMSRPAENLATLQQHMHGQFLGYIPHLKGDDDTERALDAVAYLKLPPL
mgnify:CR=1 FL=1|jgi:dethiobiotin synthetase